MAEHSFQSRDILFQEGEKADHAFIIREGEVEILKHGNNGEIRLATLKAGDIFGEMALFEHEGVRSATARAVTPLTVDALARDEFEALLSQCPPRILPLIHSVLERLRASNQRLSQSEQASVILDSEIDRILISPVAGAFDFPPAEALVARLPFRIGGHEASKPTAKNRNNHLSFPCPTTPLLVSRQHCQIEIIENGLYLVDIGSRFTTVVNGHPIGRGKGVYKAPLQKGENQVALGGVDSPYQLRIICE